MEEQKELGNRLKTVNENASQHEQVTHRNVNIGDGAMNGDKPEEENEEFTPSKIFYAEKNENGDYEIKRFADDKSEEELKELFKQNGDAVLSEEHICKYCGCKTTQPDENCWNAPEFTSTAPNNPAEFATKMFFDNKKENVYEAQRFPDNNKPSSIDSTSKIRFTFMERLQILFGDVLVVNIKTDIDREVIVGKSKASCFLVSNYAVETTEKIMNEIKKQAK